MGTRRWSMVMVAIACAVSVGCGGGEAPEQPAPAPTAPVAADDAYELDVIAEAEPDEGEPPLTVKFMGYVEEDEGSPWTFAWDFGDGKTSTDQNPVHIYTTVGDYTAELTVTDVRGNTGTDEIDIFVEVED